MGGATYYKDLENLTLNTNVLPEAQEDLTKYIGVIQSDHAYIHDGIAYGIVIETTAIAAGSTYKISLTTSTENYIHWRPTSMQSLSDQVYFRMIEGTTALSGGTAIVPVNRNRLSTELSKHTFAYNVTASTAGTILPVTFVAGSTATLASGSGRSGGVGGGDANEFVLKQGENYTFTLSNSGSVASVCILTLFWYEEEQGIDGHST